MALSQALSRASQDAAVRYQPEENALRRLLSTAYQNFTTGRQINQGSAAMIIAAARAAMPQLRAVYAQATGDTQQGYSLLQNDLGTLSAAADPQKAVAAREATAAVSRLTQASAGAQTAEVQRVDNATAGRAQGEENLYRKLVTDVGQIQQRQTDLASEKGTFIAAQGSKYQAEADKIANENYQKRLDRQSRIDLAHYNQAAQDTRQGRAETFQAGQNAKYRVPASQQGKKGKGRGFTKAQDSGFTQKVNQAWSVGHLLMTHGAKANEILSALPAKYGLPGQAAADLLTNGNGRLRPRTHQQLTQLGYHIPGQWRAGPTNPGSRWSYGGVGHLG